MNIEDKVGTFRVISSFIIRRKREFYLIGELLEGDLKENYYVKIVLNSSLVLSVKVSLIENIEVVNDPKIYQLLIIENPNDEMNDILFSLNVKHENVYIALTGED